MGEVEANYLNFAQRRQKLGSAITTKFSYCLIKKNAVVIHGHKEQDNQNP